MSPLARKRSPTACRSACGGHVAASRLDGFDRRLGRQHREVVERRQNPPLVGTLGVDVDDKGRPSRTISRGGDRGHHGGDAAGVVPVPVRQEQHVDARQVECQPLGVCEPDITIGADIEQHCRRAVPLSCGCERREAVTRHAQVVEGDDAVVPVMFAARRDASEQVCELGKLRYSRGDTRERVGCVVDDDRDGEFVELGSRDQLLELLTGSVTAESMPTWLALRGHDAADVLRIEELRDRQRPRLDTDEVVHCLLVPGHRCQELLGLGRRGLVHLREVERHLIHRHRRVVPRPLIGRHRVVVGVALGERRVERVGEALSVEERVGDSLGGDGVKVVAGVPDEGPAWSVGLAEVAREVTRGVEPLLALAGFDAFAEGGRTLDRSEERAFDITASGVELILRSDRR